MKAHFTIAAAIVVGTSLPALAADEDAEVDQCSMITIAREVMRPFVGHLGEAAIGSVAVQIKKAKAGERCAIEVAASAVTASPA